MFSSIDFGESLVKAVSLNFFDYEKVLICPCLRPGACVAATRHGWRVEINSLNQISPAEPDDQTAENSISVASRTLFQEEYFVIPLSF